MKRLISGPITATVPITCSVLQASLSLALPCMLHACSSLKNHELLTLLVWLDQDTLCSWTSAN